VLLGVVEGIARAMRRNDPPSVGAAVPVPKLGPCDHTFMAGGQHVEGVKSAVFEVCVKCGVPK
jgi:hypothetical protein